MLPPRDSRFPTKVARLALLDSRTPFPKRPASHVTISWSFSHRPMLDGCSSLSSPDDPINEDGGSHRRLPSGFPCPICFGSNFVARHNYPIDKVLQKSTVTLSRFKLPKSPVQAGANFQNETRIKIAPQQLGKTTFGFEWKALDRVERRV